MTGTQIDYAAVYRQLPIPLLLLTPEFAIADVNQASLQATGRKRDELLGRNVFDAFPSNPADPGATTVRNTIASLRRVLATGEPYAMEFQTSDIEVPGSPGLFARYYWSGVNAPVLGPDGRVELIAIMAEDVTDRLHRFMSAVESDEMYDEDSGLAATTAGQPGWTAGARPLRTQAVSASGSSSGAAAVAGPACSPLSLPPLPLLAS